MTWLPPEPRRARPRGRPWSPEGLAGVDLEGLSYIVVDEIVAGVVGLSVTPWPRLDRRGRLRFSSGPVVAVDQDALERFLARHRRPRKLARRPLRIGDAFAAAAPGVHDRDDEAPAADPAALFEPPVHDITADARDAAKTSFYGAVAPKLDPDEARGLLGDGPP